MVMLNKVERSERGYDPRHGKAPVEGASQFACPPRQNRAEWIHEESLSAGLTGDDRDELEVLCSRRQTGEFGCGRDERIRDRRGPVLALSSEHELNRECPVLVAGVRYSTGIAVRGGPRNAEKVRSAVCAECPPPARSAS